METYCGGLKEVRKRLQRWKDGGKVRTKNRDSTEEVPDRRL